MGDVSPEKTSRCCLLSAVFGRRSFWPRKSTPNSTPEPHKSRKGGGDEAAFLDSFHGTNPNAGDETSNKDRVISRPELDHMKSPPTYQQPYHHPPPVYYKNQQRTAIETPKARNAPQLQPYTQTRKVPYGSTGISGELEIMITDHQRTKLAGSLVRASSGNVMLHTNMGNLRQPGGRSSVLTQPNNSSYDYNNPTNAIQDQRSTYPTSVMGNVVKHNQNNDKALEKPTSLCRVVSTRTDPEQLKILGNEDYKNGRFEDALALYDAAISIEPNKASYRSNKSAALAALGRLLQAVFECREAIRIEPFYQRAHNRLATLYLRLGEAEKVMYHFKQAGAEADPEVLQKAKNLQCYLNKCTDAKRQRDWNTLIQECNLAISTAADSAPMIFALRAEALLRLNKHQDADETMKKGPKFEVDECTKFLGPIGHATLLVIQAQVDLAAGRFDNAVASAQLAARLDSNNKEAKRLVKLTIAIAEARSKGNDLFKSGQYLEACNAYGEGLSFDPFNSVLLCNRAACRAKLGQYQQAMDDCNAALSLRPNFSKARLRRADCCKKIKDWETCLEDCEILLKENPDAEEVAKLQKEARAHLGGRKTSQEMIIEEDFNNDVVVVFNYETFRDYVTSRGIFVVLFSDESSDRSVIQFLEQLSRRYSMVKFLKVDREDCPDVAKSEAPYSLPSFKIYKDGSTVKEIAGHKLDYLESLIKFFLS
ncbi:scaffold/adaptor protein [Lithospermum erythrorhizon]|uniref:Scaffold/adaptor protein n=1 Tax=Lithospermum erythrorhizon TaxID=34254 RepID=A0AAV3S382_LITER